MAGTDGDLADYFGDLNISTLNENPEWNSTTTYNETIPVLKYSNFSSDDFCSSNHSHVYLNVTCEFPINYASVMYGYVYPLFYF